MSDLVSRAIHYMMHLEKQGILHVRVLHVTDRFQVSSVAGDIWGGMEFDD